MRNPFRVARRIIVAGILVAFPSMVIPSSAWWPLPWWLYWPVWTTAGVAIIVIIIWRYVSEHRAEFLLIVTVLGIAVLSIVFNAAAPAIVNKSDRNAALNVAVIELAHGRYPYYARTQLGNPISPLPGAILLAAPFVLSLGSSAYQNYFWLLVLAAVLAHWSKSRRWALLILWCALLTPMVLQEFLFQSDLMTNSIYLVIAVLWFIRHPRAWWSSVFLGVALASRLNALFWLPLIFAYQARRDGVRAAAASCAVPVAIFAVLTTPFFLYDPAAFSPLHALSKIYIPNLPYAQWAIGLITLFALLVLAVRTRSELDLWQFAAIGQAVPVVLAVAAGLLGADSLVTMADRFAYGQNFLIAGLIAIFWDWRSLEHAPREKSALI